MDDVSVITSPDAIALYKKNEFIRAKDILLNKQPTATHPEVKSSQRTVALNDTSAESKSSALVFNKSDHSFTQSTPGSVNFGSRNAFKLEAQPEARRFTFFDTIVRNIVKIPKALLLSF